MSDKIYYLKDMTKENSLEWMQGLNASGYAGCNRMGSIVDRREFPEDLSVQRNSIFGIVEPKKV